MPRRTVWVPIETGGSGAATTTPVVAAIADVEPPLPVAVTTSESVVPMSSGVSVRRVRPSHAGSRCRRCRRRCSGASGR